MATTTGKSREEMLVEWKRMKAMKEQSDAGAGGGTDKENMVAGRKSIGVRTRCLCSLSTLYLSMDFTQKQPI